MSMVGRFFGITVTFCGVLMSLAPAEAVVTPVGGGFEISYDINLGHRGTSNGSGIEDVFIFEWNASQFNADYAGDVASHGLPTLSHVIDIEQTAALVFGYAAGIPGFGDEKDHLYTLMN